MTFREVVKILEANNWCLDSYLNDSYLYKYQNDIIVVVSDYGEKALPTSALGRLTNATGLSFQR